MLWGVVALVALLVGSGALGPDGVGKAFNETDNQAGAQGMNVQEFELANGMQVVVATDRRAPVVTHSVWYRVGAMDEVPGKTGLAHMTEHLMFKGTPRFPMGTMDKIVNRKGGVQNAMTSYDWTAYFQKVPTTELATMLDLEADRMANLVLTDAVFQPERSVVAEERKMRVDSSPQDLFMEQVWRQHYTQHTYGHPVIGWGEDIQGYTFDDALAWYRRHYAPNNAVLVLVGDIDAATAKPLVAATYGKVARVDDLVSRTVPVEPARTSSLTVVGVDDRVQVPSWNLIYRAPSAFAGIAGAAADPKEATALWVLAEVLGGGDTARLYQALVVEQDLADEATASYDATQIGESVFDVSVQPKPGVTLDRIAPAVQAVVATLLAEGPTDAELAKAKTSILADEVYARDDGMTTMYRLGMWLTAGGTVANFQDWQQHLKDLTAADVQRVGQRVLRLEQSTLAVLVGKREDLGTLQPTIPDRLH
jgi:zinc protease